MEYILGLALLTSMLGLCCVILSLKPSKKKEYLDNIPHSSDKKSLLEQPLIKNFVDNALKANGKEDSYAKLTKDLIMSLITGVMVFVIFIMLGYFPVGIVLGLAMLGLPFITRMMDKKTFKKKYISDFYVFLNYLILHISGGVPVDKALVEVESLIDDKSLIKGRLKNIIAKRAVSGLVGNSYVDALKDLNKDLDFSEINLFVSAAKRTAERGDSIVETLNSQLSDIQKKVDIEKRGKITSAESSFNAYQVLFCLLPVMILFLLPIFVNSIMQLSV